MSKVDDERAAKKEKDRLRRIEESKKRKDIASAKAERQLRIYALGLHEGFGLTHGNVTRVPGGWIYSSEEAAVFVPYSNEFKPQ